MHTDKQLAYLVLRITLGVNMLVHGAGRFGENHEKFVSDTVTLFANSPLPSWSVSAFAYLIPLTETVIGIFLIVGFLTRYASILGALVMVGLIFGMGVLQKWDIVGIQMIYVLFYFLLLFLIEWNRFSLDARLLSKRVQ
jgi:thiosulfate dehydrogenase [quinone] large subunit